MSWRNRVVWSEGLFLRPHHFQQQLRYVESFVEGRCLPLRTHGWGVSELRLDHDLLRIGKIGVSSARGIFPGATQSNHPKVGPPLRPIEIDENVRESRVYPAVPVRRQSPRAIGNGAYDELTRYTE